MKKFLSWNVNGVRAVEKKGFLEWLKKEDPFILAIQETKACFEQLPQSLKTPHGFHTYWESPQRKGYSGVALFCKEEPVKIQNGFGNNTTDSEGRILVAEYKEFFFINIYFPNGKMNHQRLSFKLDFYTVFLNFIKKLKTKNKTIIICGDLNTAHKEIDLSRPKENSTTSGFLKGEREYIDKLVDLDFVDTLRKINQEPGNYTWWDPITRARERNVGWRIDYFFIDKKSSNKLLNAFILKDVYGSDHCPIGIELDI